MRMAASLPMGFAPGLELQKDVSVLEGVRLLEPPGGTGQVFELFRSDRSPPSLSKRRRTKGMIHQGLE